MTEHTVRQELYSYIPHNGLVSELFARIEEFKAQVPEQYRDTLSYELGLEAYTYDDTPEIRFFYMRPENDKERRNREIQERAKQRNERRLYEELKRKFEK